MFDQDEEMLCKPGPGKYDTNDVRINLIKYFCYSMPFQKRKIFRNHSTQLSVLQMLGK